MTKPISTFKAMYNPFTRNLLVKYGEALIQHQFEDIKEWVCVSYNNDEEHPCFLHIQLDYDETAQLIFYPRVEGDEDYDLDLSSSWNSLSGGDEHIKIIHNDFEWDVMLKQFMGQINSEYRELTYLTYEECKATIETKQIINF